jgi:ATP-dependent Lhr-like helicase
LPEPFAGWFAARGWAPRAHQLALLERAQAGKSSLLIAPTGAGKTLAGFLPSLVDLAALSGDSTRPHRLHTLYVSPLKALAVDVLRNLQTPALEMGLDLRIETRTGDTPPSRRQRQRAHPPDILLTTPEQLCLLIASEHARAFFEDLKAIVVDEIHALAPTKRGDLLALAMARVERWAPGYRRTGLSATVADPAALERWLIPPSPIPGSMQSVESGGHSRRTSITPASTAAITSPGIGDNRPRTRVQARVPGMGATSNVIFGPPGAKPVIDVLDTDARIPWSGHTGRHAIGDVYEAIKRARTALVFVNTRAQAEMTFQELWRVNADNLPIALHHGSLDVEQRRKVEAAMTRGLLRAVVCTSTLDLGIDWGDVDLVIQLGAPKGCSRLVQRIGRANHRLDEPSHALLVPNNRFEVLECRAAKDAVGEGALDGEMARVGGLDCLAQHVMGSACGEPFLADELFEEVISTAPYADLPRAQYDRVVEMVATGGYALRVYDRYRRIIEDPKTSRWRARTARDAQQHRMNVGAIVEETMLTVKWLAGQAVVNRRMARGEKANALRGGRALGQIEEYFIEGLTSGDTFLFAGQILRFVALVETDVLVTRAVGEDTPKIPSYMGGKFPLSTFLADRVRRIVGNPRAWPKLPAQVREWLRLQKLRSIIPTPDQLLIETFPRAAKHYLVCYPFDGRLAHQTLGMLLTRRLERLGKKPLGFVASEYAMSVWALEPLGDVDMAALFDEDMLGDDLDAWLAESALMKRTFRTCAVIAGMIERKSPGAEKTGKQVTFSSDLIYDVLRGHEPDHVLLQAALADASSGLLDVARLGALLKRIKGAIVHKDLDRISPFAVPVMLEIGKEPVFGAAQDAILEDAESDMVAEAMWH